MLNQRSQQDYSRHLKQRVDNSFKLNLTRGNVPGIQRKQSTRKPKTEYS